MSGSCWRWSGGGRGLRRCGATAWSCFAAAAFAGAAAPDGPSVLPLPQTVHAGCPVNPQAEAFPRRIQRLDARLQELYARQQTAPMSRLLAELGRDHCELALPANKGKTRSLAELYEGAKRSVMFVGVMGHCGAPDCVTLHISTSGGAMITPSGVMLTAYHVLLQPNAVAMAAMDYDGNVYPVREVLAADKGHDVAILQLEGKGFAPLPLNADAPIGTSVAILSHPRGSYCVLSTGIITHYPILSGNLAQNKGMDVQMMGVSAEYGAGCSGAPVLNERGEIVGLVSSTQSITPGEHGEGGPQMVCRYCPPAAAVLNLIRPPGKAGAAARTRAR